MLLKCLSYDKFEIIISEKTVRRLSLDSTPKAFTCAWAHADVLLVSVYNLKIILRASPIICALAETLIVRGYVKIKMPYQHFLVYKVTKRQPVVHFCKEVRHIGSICNTMLRSIHISKGKLWSKTHRKNYWKWTTDWYKRIFWLHFSFESIHLIHVNTFVVTCEKCE